MKKTKKANRIKSKSKFHYAIHPLLTISVTDLNWLTDTIIELEQQNKKYREAITKSIAHFNQDEHVEGMLELRKALEESE